jgi:hypothetical protein
LVVVGLALLAVTFPIWSDSPLRVGASVGRQAASLGGLGGVTFTEPKPVAIVLAAEALVAVVLIMAVNRGFAGAHLAVR